ncbi:MAG: hypothetical protein FWD34_00255 [Oscillospiraceae bacterium]|nr:hypothetical protein [Oscillospiraceae bacterium]
MTSNQKETLPKPVGSVALTSTTERARETARYNRALMQAAVENGRKTKLPKWMYLGGKINGGMAWLLMFKMYGTSRALEPVYRVADKSKALLPIQITRKFKKISDDVVDFVRYTEFGVAGGDRFSYAVKAVRDCPDNIDTIISLGSGSALSEIVGLWHRKQAGLPCPKVILVDFDKKGLKRAKMFAETLEVTEYITFERMKVSPTHDLPPVEDAGNVFVISVGLLGNYFTDTVLKEILAHLSSHDYVKKICIDFVDFFLAERMMCATGWPVAMSDDQWGVFPRDKAHVEKFFVDGYKNEIIELSDGWVRFLEMTRD